MKWPCGALVVIGCTLLLLSRFQERRIEKQKREWAKSMNHVRKSMHLIPESEVVAKGVVLYQMTVPDDATWQRMARRMKQPLFFIARDSREWQPTPNWTAPLSPFLATLKVNGESRPMDPAHVHIEALDASFLGSQAPVRLGDRVEVELRTVGDGLSKSGSLVLTPYFSGAGKRGPGFDWSLARDIFIPILRWGGLGLTSLGIVLWFLSRRAGKATERLK